MNSAIPVPSLKPSRSVSKFSQTAQKCVAKSLPIGGVKSIMEGAEAKEFQRTYQRFMRDAVSSVLLQ